MKVYLAPPIGQKIWVNHPQLNAVEMIVDGYNYKSNGNVKSLQCAFENIEYTVRLEYVEGTPVWRAEEL